MTDNVLNIVLIDDDDADNYIHKKTIEATGRGKVQAEFLMAKDALDWLSQEERNINLIFLDINMPQMDGFEFLEKYNQLDKSKQADVIVVMLTSSLHPDDKTKATEFDAIFESKPLTKERFLKIIDELGL